MIKKYQVVLILISAIFCLNNTGRSIDKPVLVWGHQFGSPNHEVSRSVVADDSGNVFIAGCTSGKLGKKSFGKRDAFVAKYRKDGTIFWIQQFGTEEKDNAIHIVYKQDNIYICGETTGKLGNKQYGKKDAFVSKCDTNGNPEWTIQFGTGANDIANKIDIDNSNHLYLAGYTEGALGDKHHGEKDAYACKYNSSGKLIWKTQIGSPVEDVGMGIAVDHDRNIYVTGRTKGKLGKIQYGSSDIFVAKLNAKGTVIWIQQYGTSAFDTAMAVVVDRKGYFYVTGSTSGDFSGMQKGKADAFVFKCNPDGSIIWKQQFGTSLPDVSWGIDLCKDGSNDIIVGGCQHYRPCQAFLRRHSDQGNPKLVCEIIKNQKGYGVCGKNVFVDKSGNYYITGGTRVDLYDTHQGKGDIFIAKLKK
jgi:hypothetical protein